MSIVVRCAVALVVATLAFPQGASARPGGGFHGGGGGRAFGAHAAPRFGGAHFAPRFNARSIGGFHAAPRLRASPGLGRHFAAPRHFNGRVAGHALRRGTVAQHALAPRASAAGQASQRALTRTRFASRNARGTGAFARQAFRGSRAQRFAHQAFRGDFKHGFWRHALDRRHRFVRLAFAGAFWPGPYFWPYAYYDDVFWLWPSVYDSVFWAYGYDDLYAGIFPPYGYNDVVGALGATGGGAPSRARARSVEHEQVPAASELQLCNAAVPGLTEWPVDRVTEVLKPDDAQRAALDELKTASDRAAELLRNACPTDVSRTAPGRLDAMAKQVDALLQAVRVVRPPLEKFYGALNDEQRERFIAMGRESAGTGGRRGSRARDQQDTLARLCGAQSAQATRWPIEHIERAVKPDEAQRAKLNDLWTASEDAAKIIKDTCPSEMPLTPPGRLAAMETRLDGMLAAINKVRPALDAFYASLSDEQKARLNRVSPQTASRAR
jgi:hypothetical protein